MKRFLPLLLLALSAASSIADTIDVLPAVLADPTLIFDSGTKCVLRGNFTDTVRVRIFRGSKKELVNLARDPGYTSAACLHVPSLVVTPTRWRQLINLRFYFSPDWLNDQGTRDAKFLFVFEKAPPALPGAPLHKSEAIDLPVSDAAAAYFNSGVEVTVRAPIESSRQTRERVGTGGTAGERAANDGFTGRTVELPPSPAVRPTCVNVQFASRAVTISHASAPPPKTILVASLP